MKVFIRIMFVSLLLILAAPVYSDPAIQVYACQQSDEASDEQLEKVASAWLKAAKGMPGGENLEVFINFPVAAYMGENDFMFIVKAPSLQEWGEFMDAYPGSAASKVDEEFGDLADCPDSSLWESITIK